MMEYKGMFHWAEQDGRTGEILGEVMSVVDNQELSDLECLEHMFRIIATAHLNGEI